MATIGYGLLSDKKEEILSIWLERSLKEIPSAKQSERLALRNSLPTYLEHLSAALASNRRMDLKSVERHNTESVRIGKLHGADRAGNTNYILTEVIAEYHILREVIFQVLETGGQLSADHRDIILDSIEQAVNDAVVEFSEAHAEIQQKFIDTLTHDLRNPIAAAKLYAQMIEKNDRPEHHARFGSRIIQSLNRVDAMINDLLDAGRVRAGEPLALQYFDCDLAEVLDAVVEEMVSLHGDRFVVETERKLKGHWGCDGLRRAIENLVGNAVKYGSGDTPIRLSLVQKDEWVELAVQNAGTPIPRQDLPMLFQQYRRSTHAGQNVKSGWGLGLSVVQGVADAHNGTVKVESTSAEGTRFTLRIPSTGKARA